MTIMKPDPANSGIWIYLHVESNFKAVHDKQIRTNLKGFANTRWPMVTKLVSWFDINQASDETLKNKKNVSINNWHHFMFDDKNMYLVINTRLNTVTRHTFR